MRSLLVLSHVLSSFEIISKDWRSMLESDAASSRPLLFAWFVQIEAMLDGLREAVSKEKAKASWYSKDKRTLGNAAHTAGLGLSLSEAEFQRVKSKPERDISLEDVGSY